FFSSRRRHTRFSRDWSSDVCSSDLAELGLSSIGDPALTYLGSEYAAAELEVAQVLGREQRRAYQLMVGGIRSGGFPRLLVVGRQIGRASCRESGEGAGEAGSDRENG